MTRRSRHSCSDSEQCKYNLLSPQLTKRYILARTIARTRHRIQSWEWFIVWLLVRFFGSHWRQQMMCSTVAQTSILKYPLSFIFCWHLPSAHVGPVYDVMSQSHQCRLHCCMHCPPLTQTLPFSLHDVLGSDHVKHAFPLERRQWLPHDDVFKQAIYPLRHYEYNSA